MIRITDSATPHPQFPAKQIMKNLISQAMQDPDNLVIELQYKDRKNCETRRIVSPIRFLSPDRFIALCLCREEPRVFSINECRNVSLKPAWDYLMPVEMVVISPVAGTHAA